MNYLKNIIIILSLFILMTSCKSGKDIASSLKYEKGDIECLFAISDNTNCKVKRLSSSQLCNNLKNWKNKKNINKETYNATLQELNLRNFKNYSLPSTAAPYHSNSPAAQPASH